MFHVKWRFNGKDNRSVTLHAWKPELSLSGDKCELPLFLKSSRKPRIFQKQGQFLVLLQSESSMQEIFIPCSEPSCCWTYQMSADEIEIWIQILLLLVVRLTACFS